MLLKRRVIFVIAFLIPSFAFAWVNETNWSVQKATDDTIVLQKAVADIDCESGKSLRFPNVMHSAQNIYLDGKLISAFGQIDPPMTISIYGSPKVSCEVLQNAKAITWEVHSPIEYFRKIRQSPWVSSNNGLVNFSDASNILIIGGLLVFTLLLYAFSLKSPLQQQGFRLCLFSFSMMMFFLSSVCGHFAINLDYLVLDKVACLSLGCAVLFFVDFLKYRALVGEKLAKFMKAVVFLSTLPIPFLIDGNQVQSLLNIIFLPAIICVWIPILLIHKYSEAKTLQTFYLPYLALVSFAVATTSDILYTMDVHHFGFSLGYGVIAFILFFTAAIQVDIHRMYSLLEHLKVNLQKEVEEKTKDLRFALAEKEKAQAELIQSAKLASLGTLSAGIAHEINNSINYVNGAVIPLEKIMMGVELDEKRKTMMLKLLNSIKEGSKLTVDIVRSLRNYTGLNQAKYDDVPLLETVDSVLTILRNKIGGDVEISKDIDPNLTFYGNKVGINQVVMNLISNALDALNGKGMIKVTAIENSDDVVLIIEDNGPGMPQDVQDRIFDPFYTTKEVGSGTGLGLHIVKKEVENHNGHIQVFSEVGQGTKFVLCFVKTKATIEQGEAA